ncbi:hypothetical protein CWI36_0010p0040 [Hamiltosporidium magnivora]|uniref:Leucine-rich repeat-containing protein n=1 Tax=Hamiltosporidium magnivora TaxID=148818 RepID=A0A4Q9LQK1_9MICR|nr:hypothetical protein CWI36_0010p0040 [Hamiltosporidium magnivora]
MYFFLRFRHFCSTFPVRNIEIQSSRSKMFMVMFRCLIEDLYGLCFLNAVYSATLSNNGRIEFALIDWNWIEAITREDLAAAKYWLARQNERNVLDFCPGNHFFRNNRIYPEFFVCPHGLSFLYHKPLHILEVNYRDDWKVRFRVLNYFLSKNSNEPFLFYRSSFGISYQLFSSFVKYLTSESFDSPNDLSYELFYKFIKILDVLDPISSDFLSEFYYKLYKDGLMNSISVDIINDSENYRLRFFNEKKRRRPFMYFFGVLNDFLDACLIPNISTLSIFKKKNQSIDQFDRLVLKISACSLDFLMPSLAENAHIFNWLLSVTEISGFYFDNTEFTFNPINFKNVCGFMHPEIPKKSSDPLQTVPSDFFIILNDDNQRRMQYLRFVNVDICFDIFETLLSKTNISYFEVSYCSVDECHKITELLEQMPELNVFILHGVGIRPDDLDRILFSKIEILVLVGCIFESDSVWISKESPDFVYEIMKNLRTLNVSASKLPIDFLHILLHSFNLENLNISRFEFLPANSSFSLISLRKNRYSLQLDKYIPNKYLEMFSRTYFANFLSLCDSFIFSDIVFFFNIGDLIDSVKFLDLSDNLFPAEFLTLIDNFKNLKKIKLSASLPSSTVGLPNLGIFETVMALDVSRNDINATNYDFVSKFKGLKSLSLANCKLENKLLKKIMTKDMCATLISLDLSGVDLCFLDFKNIVCCKQLKILYFQISNDHPLSYYCDYLELTSAKLNLNVLKVEIKGGVCFDDLVSLAGFSNLSEVKITCSTFIKTGEENFIRFNPKISNFRLELCLKYYNLDIDTLNILDEMFENCSISIVSPHLS